MFNLNDYEDVATRIKKFREKYDSGRIVVDVISHDVKEGIILVEASVYRYSEDTLPAATDIALGIASTYNANMRKFYAEDTSTSAIGRAIGLLFGTDKRPTKEDMKKVEASNNDWETFVSDKPTKKEPELMDKSVEMLQAALGAEVIESVPQCTHGDMKLREGVGKTGKPYHGYTCKERVSACKPIWYNLSSNGTWVVQDSSVK